MITEHYDFIEVLHKKEVERHRMRARTYCVVAYVVRESSTPMRVGYPGEVLIPITPGSEIGLMRKPFTILYAAEVGDLFRARFVEPLSPHKPGSDLRLDKLWGKVERA